MDASRWERLQTLFHAAADLPSDEQRSYLASACDDDPSLADEALALLAADARGNPVLDRGIATLAHEVVGWASYAPPASHFGPYRVTRVLGEGGMGVVYFAERDDLGTVAAIKILRDAWLSPARRERFASEQRTLAQLNHPLIARLYDADTLPDGTPWFVMEYVEGETLTEYCRTHAASMEQRLRLFRDVCEAVQHAHRHLVVHRDLKPSNILVTGEGGVKLLDFGIAKHLESLDAADDRTRPGVRLMTPAYAAPEQIRAGRVGMHTDVYALGVILYELLAGVMPFDLTELTPGEAEKVLVEGEADRPAVAAKRAAAADAPRAPRPTATSAQWADLDVLCLTAMHKDPQRRYGTVDALMRDIDHYLKAEPLEARTDSVRYRLGKFVRRHWRLVAAASTVLTLVVALVVFYTVRLTIARNTALTEVARAQRIQRFTLNLFEGGDKAVGPADTLKAVTLVDRGLREAQSLDAEPEVQAELYLTLGGIYQKLGNLSRADSLLRLSLDKHRALFGENHRDVAANLVALGLLRVDQARFEEAEQLIREGLDVARRTLPPKDPAIAKADAALGRVLQERGQYDKAIPVLQDVVRLYEAPSARLETRDLAASLSALADVHFYSGHYAISDSLNQRVLAMYRQSYGERHPLVADILINLGASQFDLGNYAAAERFDLQALDITQAFYGPDHFKTAGNLTMLGRALVFEDRYDEAVVILRRALSIRERVYGPMHPLVASTVNELANIAIRREQWVEAETQFRRMLAIYHAVYGDKHYLIGLATSNLASAFMGRKDYAGAEGLYREAVRRFTDAQGPNHVNTGIARIKLGRSLLRQNHFAEAQVETLAGYDVLAKQANPAVSFLQNARKDLVAEYDSLKQPDRAAKFRAEMAESTSKAPAKPK
ncbi:MAG: serine/threonine-protein kinase [bacterium]